MKKLSIEELRLRKNKRMNIYYQTHKEERKKYYQTHKKEAKEYREGRKEKINLYSKKYHETHKNKEIEYRNTHKIEKRIYNKKYVNHKLKTDINFKLAHCLRNRLRIAIYNNQKSGSAVRDLGCSVSELKLYLEEKFQPGMTWKNWSPTGWHIDHIVPLDLFDLSNRGEFLKAVNYTNLQPMWAEENIKKSNRVI